MPRKSKKLKIKAHYNPKNGLVQEFINGTLMGDFTLAPVGKNTLMMEVEFAMSKFIAWNIREHGLSRITISFEVETND